MLFLSRAIGSPEEAKLYCHLLKKTGKSAIFFSKLWVNVKVQSDFLLLKKKEHVVLSHVSYFSTVEITTKLHLILQNYE